MKTVITILVILLTSSCVVPPSYDHRTYNPVRPKKHYEKQRKFAVAYVAGMVIIIAWSIQDGIDNRPNARR